MKLYFCALFFISLPAFTASQASAVQKANPANKDTEASEPLICYAVAWETAQKGGLGLNRGQAITLCSGAANARQVIDCYRIAWGHPDEGGLGLNIGQAVTLCKKNGLPAL